MGQNQFDLIVIGGGILGTFHAYHALAAGKSVALFERDASPRGASVRNFGQVVPSGMAPRWQSLGRRSLEIYKSIQSRFDIGLRANGSFYVASDAGERKLIEELYKINQLNGYPSELLEASDCLRRIPALRAETCQGGLFFPDEVSVNPRLLVGRLHEFLRTNPRFVHFPARLARAAEPEGEGVRVVDGRGTNYFASKAIICSGDEFRVLFPELFLASDLELVKLQMVRLGPQRVRIPGNILTGLSIRRYESFRECPSYSAVKANEDPRSFWKQWGIHILFKQEDDGTVILGDSHEYLNAGAATDPGFDLRSDINEYFVSEGKKILTLDHWNIEQQWYGVYTQCKTRDVFEATIADRIFVITGIGGKGMTASAGFAEENIRRILRVD